MCGFGFSCSPGWPLSLYRDETSFQLLILLPLSPEKWDCKHKLAEYVAFIHVQEVKPKLAYISF